MPYLYRSFSAKEQKSPIIRNTFAERDYLCVFEDVQVPKSMIQSGEDAEDALCLRVILRKRAL